MFDKIKTVFKSNKKPNEYYYDFIPYKQIGPIKLDKNVELKGWGPTSARYLGENGINFVRCAAMCIGSPERKRRGMISDKVYIKYNSETIIEKKSNY